MERIGFWTLCRGVKLSRRTACQNGIGVMIKRRPLSTTTCLRAGNPSKKPAKKTRKHQSDYKPSSIRPPPPPSMTSPAPKTRSNPLRYRTIPMLFGGVTLFILSGYCTYLYVNLSRPVDHPVPIEASSQSDVSKRYDAIANTFDSSVDWTEKLMGITRLRKKLAKEAKGDVLEVSMGTGRNLKFYDFEFKNGKAEGRVKSFTAIDKSPEMLEIAHEKFTALYPGILGVRWVIGHTAEEGIIPPPPKNVNERSRNKVGEKYDTVVQTMGLCSVGDPVALLKCLGNVVKEEEGRILLLEHGRGRWQWLNGILDKFAEGHAKEFGCWWNRDLSKVVSESGLQLVTLDTWHGGTTYWIELKKPKFEPAKVEVKAIQANQIGTSEPKAVGKKGWW